MRYPIVASLWVLLALVGGCASSPTDKTAQTEKSSEYNLDARLAEVRMLANQRRFEEAVRICEQLVKENPKDGNLTARLANLLSRQADTETDEAKYRALRRRARALAEKAELLGTNDPLSPMLLQSIPEDGSKVAPKPGERVFSKREEVDALIQQGEKAFKQGNLAEAGACYQKAFALEPDNFMAALWSGDALFSAGDVQGASEWFRKAIAIQPKNETGHRYLGDALARLGQRDAAMSEWIEALLCEPYVRLTRQHFTADMKQRSEANGYRIPRFPMGTFAVDATKKELSIASGDDAVVALYSIACGSWRMNAFEEAYPKEKTLRRSLREEIAGLEILAAIAKSSGEKDEAEVVRAREKWQAQLDDLALLSEQGLLEPYALLERPDQELAKDYSDYAAANHEKLVRYVRRYWCGLDSEGISKPGAATRP
jgi:tetratricopeptide (TPR) repeat protein